MYERVWIAVQPQEVNVLCLFLALIDPVEEACLLQVQAWTKRVLVCIEEDIRAVVFVVTDFFSFVLGCAVD